MTDPLSLGVIGGVVIAEGIKFLYGQAGALLAAWRERRERQRADVPLPALAQPPTGVLDAAIDSSATPDEEELARVYDELSRARRALSAYADDHDPQPVDPADPETLQAVQELRGLLESVYGQRLTFAGEQREPTGTRMRARVDARRLRDATVAGIQNAGLAGEDAQAEVVVEAQDVDRSHVVGIDYGSPRASRRP